MSGPYRGVLLRASTGRLEGQVSLRVGELGMEVSLVMDGCHLHSVFF